LCDGNIVSGVLPSISNHNTRAEATIALIIGTTIHAQDFRDVEGDKLNGRTTLPILLPRGSRWLAGMGIVAWSIGLSQYSALHWAGKIVFVTLGAGVGTTFVWKGEKYDKGYSYDAYNVSTIAMSAEDRKLT
jgi:4-hydroxybenzoate polyprenyltransferase